MLCFWTCFASDLDLVDFGDNTTWLSYGLLTFNMPSAYTPAEYANMHFIYGECQGNANAAAQLYRER